MRALTGWSTDAPSASMNWHSTSPTAPAAAGSRASRAAGGRREKRRLVAQAAHAHERDVGRRARARSSAQRRLGPQRVAHAASATTSGAVELEALGAERIGEAARDRRRRDRARVRRAAEQRRRPRHAGDAAARPIALTAQCSVAPQPTAERHAVAHPRRQSQAPGGMTDERGRAPACAGAGPRPLRRGRSAAQRRFERDLRAAARRCARARCRRRAPRRATRSSWRAVTPSSRGDRAAWVRPST